MGYELTQGSTAVPLTFIMRSSADHVTPVTGANPTVNLSKNGFPFAVPVGAVVEVGLGTYQLEPDAADVDTVGSLTLHAAAVGCDTWLDVFTVVAPPAAPVPIPPSEAIVLSAEQVIRRALSVLGKVGAGEPVHGDLLVEAFGILNEMIDNWKTQKLLIPQLVRVEYPLVPGVTSLTIGPGGDIDMERPHAVRFAFVIDPGSPSLERPIPVLNEEAYALRPYKVMTDLTAVSQVYYQPTHPLGTLKIPAGAVAGGTLVLYVLVGLPSFADLTTEYLLMPGYAKALRYNLAIQLAPSYGVQPTNLVFSEAATSVGDIKRLNIRHRVLANYFPGRGGDYNVYSDEHR